MIQILFTENFFPRELRKFTPLQNGLKFLTSLLNSHVKPIFFLSEQSDYGYYDTESSNKGKYDSEWVNSCVCAFSCPVTKVTCQDIFSFNIASLPAPIRSKDDINFP